MAGSPHDIGSAPWPEPTHVTPIVSPSDPGKPLLANYFEAAGLSPPIVVPACFASCVARSGFSR